MCDRPITLALAGYVGWCTHWLWMDAPVPELLEIPAEYREDAKELVVEHGLTKRAVPALSWSVVWFSLQQPYQAAKLRSRVQVIMPWKGRLTATSSGAQGSAALGSSAAASRTCASPSPART